MLYNFLWSETFGQSSATGSGFSSVLFSKPAVFSLCNWQKCVQCNRILHSCHTLHFKGGFLHYSSGTQASKIRGKAQRKISVKRKSLHFQAQQLNLLQIKCLLSQRSKVYRVFGLSCFLCSSWIKLGS